MSSPVLRWTPSFAGLLATAWIGWVACPTPPEQPFTLDSLFGVIAKYAAVLCLTTVWVGWCSAAFIPSETKRDARRLVLRMSAVALWLAPLMIFLSQHSMWAVPIMGLFAAGVVKALRVDQSSTDSDENTESLSDAPPRGFLSSGLPPPQPGRRAAVVAIAAFGQSALVALLVGVSLAASLFLGLGVALLAWLLPSSRNKARPPTRGRRSFARHALSMATAMLLVLVGLIPYVRTGEGPSQRGWFAFLEMGAGSADTAEPKAKKRKKDRLFSRKTDDMADPLSPSFPGVILWPEAKPHVTLVPPPAVTYGRITLDRTKTFSVPFDGVYWFLRSDTGPPPENAFVTRGSPVDRTFRTTTRSVPLWMLARQNFGSLIDVSCCDRIEVEISNADVHPDTVSLKLTLVNTTLPGQPSQSLGRALVRSMPRVTRDNEVIPSRETLMFFIPENTVLQTFDEVAISFGRDWKRRNQSVKVAIDRFVLIPRGRSSIPKRLPPIHPQRIAD